MRVPDKNRKLGTSIKGFVKKNTSPYKKNELTGSVLVIRMEAVLAMSKVEPPPMPTILSVPNFSNLSIYLEFSVRSGIVGEKIFLKKKNATGPVYLFYPTRVLSSISVLVKPDCFLKV